MKIKSSVHTSKSTEHKKNKYISYILFIINIIIIFKFIEKKLSAKILISSHIKIVDNLTLFVII